ncbi:hypothetical protein [Luteipulveratus flavus]
MAFALDGVSYEIDLCGHQCCTAS